MCRIKFEETFRMNVGVPNLSKKKLFEKLYFRKDSKM